MIKTVNLTTEVTAVDVTGKQNVIVKNIGNNTAYVSASPDISVGGDDCLSVKAGEIVTLEGVATLKKVNGQYGVYGTVYALASNATTIELIPTNTVNFKSAAADFSGEISDISALIPAAASAGNQLTDKAYVDSGLAEKVDKETGKSLVSDSEIARLSAVDNYDDTAVKADIQAIQGLIPSSASTSNQLADKAYVSAATSGSPYTYMTQAEYEALTEYEPDRLYYVIYPLSKCHLIWCNGECVDGIGAENLAGYKLNRGTDFVVARCQYKYLAIAYNTTNYTSLSYDIDANYDAVYPNLIKLDVANGVSSIGKFSFANCNKLTSVSIPSTVTIIGNSAFYCSNLATITINKPADSISGSPWGATNATIVWTG